jgi:class 3 adenylate cyclase
LEEPDINRMISVSSKMMFFMVTVLLFIVIVVALMVFMDIRFLIEHRYVLGEEMYMGVFKDIVFALTVLLFLSILILGKYSKNLKKILNIQIGVMDEISKGNYQTRVPVVSNDEFGLIAHKTNEMIKGLKEKEFCQLSFGRYVTPEVSQKILKGELVLKGEKVFATIMFCDLRGYTPLAERKDPQYVVELLNEYFTEMEKAIKKYNGIILQYIGDEIEAVFGAPLELENHADMAILSALEMRRRLELLNQKRKQRGEDLISHGIGIHTGEVLGGSVGSPDRLVYAMVGDTVNTASRIQTLNKEFGTDILISEETKRLLKNDSIPLESLGRIVLKGRVEEIEIFRVL